MKSEKAKEYINTNGKSLSIVESICYVVAELAEEEMRERAIKAFCAFQCPRTNYNCIGANICKSLILFIDKLDNPKII